MTSKTLQVVYVGNTTGVDTALKKMDSAHASFASKLSSTGKKMVSTGKTMTYGLTLPIVGVGFSAVKASMEFEKSMNTMKAVAGLSSGQVERLGDLAMKMGRDTVFSANEAAQAMVELSKSGIKPADIAAGALENSLALATAGDLELADAAKITANAMNVFNLSGGQSKQAADALAGAANASSADVGDLALALSQGGLAASNAGLSIQETTAILGAFADAGIKGSDAGTSLKTFLLNLVPTSVKAKEAMKDLGMSFVDNKGRIMDMAGIADELQGSMKGLTQAQQQVALKTIFGTDAFRAASVIADEGAKGLGRYEDATSKVGTASKVADAKMKGLPGAIETLKGSAETFLLVIGNALAPMVQAAAEWFSKLLNKLSQMSPFMQKVIIVIGILVAAIGPLLMIFGAMAMAIGAIIPVVAAITAPMLVMAAVIAGIVIVAGVLAYEIIHYWTQIKQVALAVWEPIKNALMTFWGWVGPFVKGAFKVIIGIFKAYFAVLKAVWKVAWFALKNIVWPALKAIWAILKPFFQVVKSLFQIAWNAIKSVTKTVWNAVKTFIITPVKAVVQFVKPYLHDFVSGLKTIWNAIKDPVKSAWNYVVDIIRGAIGIIGDLVNNAINIVNGFIKVFNAIPGHGDVDLVAPVHWGEGRTAAASTGGAAPRITQSLMGRATGATGGAAGGGGGGGGQTIIVNVAGSVQTEQDLAESIRRALLKNKGRNGGALGLA